ncbi:MAG: NAD(+)/NADH kinase [Candidatus Limnocylindrus sp.]|jgi:NAD+ kinase
MRRYGFVYNPTNDLALEAWDEAAGWCAARGIECWGYAAESREEIASALPGSEVLISLGGDGTFLRAAAAVAESSIPLLGINLGKIGFLARSESFQLASALEAFTDGKWSAQERMALHATVQPANGGARRFTALNDVVVARGRLPRVVRLDVAIAQSHLATYIADGIVISSPTGSTGYSFSAGGPILDPVSRNIIVTPIAAYLATLRSVVVPAEQVVTCTVVDGEEAVISIDGWIDEPLAIGDRVSVSAAPLPIRFAELHGLAPFWDLVRQKVDLLPR